MKEQKTAARNSDPAVVPGAEALMVRSDSVIAKRILMR